MNKNYKYWVYYLSNEIYAYTDDKVLAKQYERERDMTQFKKCKKEIAKGTVNFLADNYQDCMLKHLKGYTKIGGMGSEIVEFDIAVTNEEYICTMNTAVYITEQKITGACWTNPGIFEPKYRALLDKSGYTTKWLKVKYGKHIKVIQEELDYLAVFLKLYKEYMKE